jgi:hypothetical protein
MKWAGRAPRGAPIVGIAILAGVVCGSATISMVASATPRATSAGAVFDVTHVPPLLTLPGEEVQLAYDAHCAPAGVESPETPCRVEGTVFARPFGTAAFREIPLERADGSGARLVAAIPGQLSNAPRFEYYAVLESAEADARVTVPAGGASATAISYRLSDPTPVALGRHEFGVPQDGDRVAAAGWGEGPDEAGLEPRPSVGEPIGASAFDIDSTGAVVLLDHAHRRVLRFAEGRRPPERIPLSINGTIADLAAAADGSLYVLETTSRDGRSPLIRRFAGDGRELEATEAAERGPAQIRIGPEGPVVLQRPSHQWMPATVAGMPATPDAQRGRGRMGRPLRNGSEVVVFRLANELRIALVTRGVVMRAWRITSATSLGEVQLAEPVGAQFVVVVRVFDDAQDEFAVMVLDQRGLRSRTPLASAEWAESAPLGRFRLVDRSLYRLGSSPIGVFVDRYDLEVRR